jgi:hypothetical protein
MSAAMRASWQAQIMSALAAGVLDPGGEYATSTGKCAGASAPAGPGDLQLAAQSLGVAGAGATAGLAIAGVAGATIPIVGAGIAIGTLFLSLIGRLFGPPVSQLEQKTLCPLVSAANALLVQITSELQTGYITSSTAKSAINALYSSFQSKAASIEYIQTPNDTQFMLSALNALVIKNTASGGPYDQLAAQAKAQIAAQQASAAAAQQAQITAAANAAVNSALAKVQAGPAPTSSPTVAIPGTGQGSGPSAAAPVSSGSVMVLPAAIVTDVQALPSWLKWAGIGIAALVVMRAI